MGDTGMDEVAVAQMLDGLIFPAARWQVIAHADHWGAGGRWAAQLTALEARTYDSVADVSAALGRARAPHVPRGPVGPPRADHPAGAAP